MPDIEWSTETVEPLALVKYVPAVKDVGGGVLQEMWLDGLKIQSAALQSQRFSLWQSGSAAGGSFLGGGAYSTTGTFAVKTPTTASRFKAYAGWGTYRTLTVADTPAGVWGQKYFFRGDATTRGGFLFYSRFGLENWTTGDRLFAGLVANIGGTGWNSNAGIDGNFVGFSVDSGDTAIHFTHRDNGANSQVKTSTGITPTTGEAYETWIYMPPNAGVIYYQIKVMSTGAVVSGSSSNTVRFPDLNLLLGPQVGGGNAANTTTGAFNIAIDRFMVLEPE